MTQTFSNGDTPQDHSETSSTAPDVVIITGMSGAGRTEAMHTFEDLGYFCIDNLPPSLIMNMISLASLPGQNEIGRKLAIVCDARNREYFKQLVGELANMEAAGVTFRVIFLDAADSILMHVTRLRAVAILYASITNVPLGRQFRMSVVLLKSCDRWLILISIPPI